ncbi:MAG TPA: hypothetical protein VL128_09740 [Candidatus Eisenbacteria bacterium]|nr:hypothetical protein [Candidatus Eisenbacteria bacterium]
MSRYTRLVGGLAGLAGGIFAAFLVARLFAHGVWVARVVAAILGFGLISAFGVLLAGDLVVRTNESPTAFPHPAK